MLGLLFLLLGGEVVDSAASGFTSQNVVEVSAAPDAAYSALVDEVDQWWNADHTYTGDSTNLVMEADAGGCFCETLDNDGSVQHMEVVYAEPGKTLRMRGGLGPLQAMAVAGAMTFTIEASETGSTITLTYVVGGYAPGEAGLGALAEPVDGVLRTQLEGLAHFLNQP